MRSLLLALGLFFLASPVWAQKVTADYNKTVDFSKFKTYSWVKGIPAKNPFVDKMIVDDIDRELAARGLTRQEADGDIKVMYRAAIDYDLQAPMPNWNSAGGSAPSTGIATIGTAWDVRQGTLLVDIIDRGTTNIIWRGSAVKTLNRSPSNDAAKDASRIEKPVKDAIAKMFKKYPVNR